MKDTIILGRLILECDPPNRYVGIAMSMEPGGEGDLVGSAELYDTEAVWQSVIDAVEKGEVKVLDTQA